MEVEDLTILEEMWRDVDIVVNIAATTNFDEREKSGLMEDPYKMGETLNGEGGLDIYKEKQIIEDALS
ncbi:hypothetical protein AgCh_020258 [Apium graveolens]